MFNVAILIALVMSARLIRQRHRTLSNLSLALASILVLIDIALLVRWMSR